MCNQVTSSEVQTISGTFIGCVLTHNAFWLHAMQSLCILVPQITASSMALFFEKGGSHEAESTRISTCLSFYHPSFANNKTFVACLAL